MKQYHIKPSLTLLNTILVLYGLFVTGLVLHFEWTWSTSLLLVLALLLLLFEIQLYYEGTGKKTEFLSIDLTNMQIKHEISGINRKYEGFSVYTNRWWLALKLGQRFQGKYILLLADCFQSKNEYLDFRYQLIQLKKEIHVT